MKELLTAKTRRVLNTLAITSLVGGGFLLPTIAHADPATNYAEALVAGSGLSPIDASYQGAVSVLPQGGVVLRVGNQTPLSYVEFNANLPSPKLVFFNSDFASDIPQPGGGASGFVVLLDGQNIAVLPPLPYIASTTINPWTNAGFLGNQNGGFLNLEYPDVTYPLDTAQVIVQPGIHNFVIALSSSSPSFKSGVTVQALDPPLPDAIATQSVPEPSTVLGTFGFGLGILGAGWRQHLCSRSALTAKNFR